MILGAYASQSPATSILDIGAGTGVLGRMVLQRNPEATLTAVECNAEALLDLNHNLSDLGKQATVIGRSIFDFQPAALYDLIVCNPPFHFEKVMADNQNRETARRADNMPVAQLLKWIRTYLSHNGVAWLIYPFSAKAVLQEYAAECALHIAREIEISGKPNTVHRWVVCFSKRTKKPKKEFLMIRDADGGYTPEYILLTRDFHATDLSNSNNSR